MQTDRHTEREREFSRLVARELAAEAKRQNVLQRDLAKAAGISAEHLSHAIGGRKAPLTVGVLVRAAERLGLDPKVIVERAYARLSADTTAPRPATPRSGSVAVQSRPAHAPSRSRAQDGRGTTSDHS